MSLVPNIFEWIYLLNLLISTIVKMERTMNIRIDEEEAEVDGARSEGTSEEVEADVERLERKEDGELDEVKRSSLSNDIECFKRELTL